MTKDFYDLVQMKNEESNSGKLKSYSPRSRSKLPSLSTSSLSISIPILSTKSIKKLHDDTFCQFEMEL